MSTISKDDPRLTAYILGETSATERAAIEAALAADPALRIEAEATRALAGELGRALAGPVNDGSAVMHAHQRAAIAAAAAAPGRAPIRFPAWGLLLAAACVLCVVSLGVALYDQQVPPQAGTELALAPDTARADGEVLKEVAVDVAPSAPVPQETPAETGVFPGDQPRSPDRRDRQGSKDLPAPLVAVVAPEAKGDPKPGFDGEPVLPMQPLAVSRVASAPASDRSAGGDQYPSGNRPRDESTAYRFCDPAPAPATAPPVGTAAPRPEAPPLARTGERMPGQPQPTAEESAQGKYQDKNIAGGGGQDPACPPPMPHPDRDWGRPEPQLPALEHNRFTRLDQPGGDASTFAIDVDTASLALVRKHLGEGRLPPADQVRIEELVNAFAYAYAPPADGRDFAVHAEFSDCPWNPRHRLARLAVKGREIAEAQRPALNLVFLLDVSGSMQAQDKLPLLKDAMLQLTARLDARDRVAIVTYSDTAQVVLPSTSAAEPERIRQVVQGLRAKGSTNGEAGIRLAYEQARAFRIHGGANRIVLCSDGDFNVGMQDRGALADLVQREAQAGIQLTALGFGMGDLRDATMETLGNRGDGNYAYIDDAAEASQVLVEDFLATLIAIAQDVKIQIFFNPRQVAGWRLIGYENRQLAAQDFNNDHADGGELGAGHAVTAIYELVPAGQAVPAVVDANPFLATGMAAEAAAVPGGGAVDDAEASLRWRLRWQPVGGGASQLEEFDVRDDGRLQAQTSSDTRFAIAVAAFGMLLRGSPDTQGLDWSLVERLASDATAAGTDGRKAAFLELIALARRHYVQGGSVPATRER